MKCSCCSLEKKICFFCDNEYMFFFNKPNVVGVALGHKFKNGFNTLKKCITVFVCKKVNSSALTENELVPLYYKNIETDVVESGFFTPNSLTDRVRPVEGGYRVGAASAYSGGTFGCLVSDAHNIYILSNNHVIAGENKFSIGREIIQPDRTYGGKPIKDAIATLSKFIPLKGKKFLRYETNYADCAIAKVITPSFVSSEIALIGKPKGITTASLNQPIKKVGCSTELTTGIVTNTNATIKLKYSSFYSLFKEQIICNCAVKSGDSGAVVLDNNNYIIGLIMAGSSVRAIANPISYILNTLEVNIVTH